VKTILISGGKGKFAKTIDEVNSSYKIISPSKKEMNIKNLSSILNFINKRKIDYFIHAAAFSAPMKNHKIELEKSISTNIIGSANVALACIKKNIKLIYISTNFVYPGTNGKYSEKDSLMPVNEYGWSKLGGECAAHIYKNSLILRICMNDDDFPHKSAFTNYITSFMKKTDAAKLTLKLLNKKGIINIGGKTQSAYDYAKNNNAKINRIKLNKENIRLIGSNTSLNINKLKKIIKI
tara:strand:- start:22 stop:732 length:711 start_codon:yes stop_codon:yes gene_type:complete